MAVLVTNGNVNLSTANGFYVSYANNFGCSANNPIAISSNTIALTFSSNHTCIGVIMALGASNVAAWADTVTVALQENVATVWTTRVSASSSVALYASSVLKDFSFGAGYAVTTAASTWRLLITSTAGQIRLHTSNGSAISYVTYSDTTASFSSGSDQIVCKDILTIDQTATIASLTGTGGTVNTSVWVCAGSGTEDDTAKNNRRFVWQNPPAASYTLTLNGCIMYGQFTGIEIGSSTNPIPVANAAIISCASQFIMTPTGTISGAGARSSMQIWGEYPSVLTTRLTVAAVNPTTTLTVADSTGFAINDIIFIGGGSDSANYTITNVPDSTTIEINSAIPLGLDHNVNNFVHQAKPSKWGVQIKSSSTSTLRNAKIFLGGNYDISGVYWENINFIQGGTANSFGWDYSEEKAVIQNCCMNNKTASAVAWMVNVTPVAGVSFSNCVFNLYFAYAPGTVITQTAISDTQGGVLYESGSIEFTNLWFSNQNGAVFSGQNYTWVANGVYMQRSGTNPGQFCGKNSVFTNIELIDISISFNINQLSNGTITNLTSRRSVISIGTNVFDSTLTNFVLDTPSAGYLTIGSNNQFSQILIDGTNQALTFTNYGAAQQWTLLGDSYISVTNENGTTNQDYTIKPNGTLYRCGSGLTDTTVYGSNSYSLKFSPNRSPYLLSFSYDALIGNQQNYDMFVYMWVKINNANYYAGTHQLPRLYVTYDQTSSSYSQAAESTSWQQLIVPIKPTTTYPSITIELKGYTDATGTDADFYLGQIGVVLPAGRNVDPGTLDYWSKAQPLTGLPTSLSAFDVWSVPTSQLTGSGTVGKFVTKLLTVAKFIGLK